MNTEVFMDVLNDQIRRSTDVLMTKSTEYATVDDRLYNFRVAAALRGESLQSALAGMMAKHTVSVYDMCKDDAPIFSEEFVNEKITDHINYLLLLRAVLEEVLLEKHNKNTEAIRELRKTLSGE